MMGDTKLPAHLLVKIDVGKQILKCYFLAAAMQQVHTNLVAYWISCMCNNNIIRKAK